MPDRDFRIVAHRETSKWHAKTGSSDTGCCCNTRVALDTMATAAYNPPFLHVAVRPSSRAALWMKHAATRDTLELVKVTGEELSKKNPFGEALVN